MGGLVIIFLIYKKFIIKKVGEKIGKVFLIISFFLIVISLARYFIIQPFIIKGEALKPYLNANDYCLAEIFNKSIKKGDIVIIEKMYEGFITSLVIGLPGDKIELKDGIFFINGEPLKNVSYNFYHVNGVDSNTGNYFIVVPPDSFFGIPTLLDEKFADNAQTTQENSTTSVFKVSSLSNEELSTNEQTIQEHQNISNSLCPYENSYLNPKDNLCYCKEGYVFNKEKTKCITYNEACSLLYGSHSIAGKGDAKNKYLCYCEEGYIFNKKEGKDIKCVKGIDFSVDLYKQSDILGKVIHCFHIGK